MLYYCVVENFQGEIEVVSYLSKTKREETKIAKQSNKKLLLVTTNSAVAHRRAKSSAKGGA